jgi:hypothetical protein
MTKAQIKFRILLLIGNTIIYGFQNGVFLAQKVYGQSANEKLASSIVRGNGKKSAHFKFLESN